jgi:hypothetical protein
MRVPRRGLSDGYSAPADATMSEVVFSQIASPLRRSLLFLVGFIFEEKIAIFVLLLAKTLTQNACAAIRSSGSAVGHFFVAFAKCRICVLKAGANKGLERCASCQLGVLPRRSSLGLGGWLLFFRGRSIGGGVLPRKLLLSLGRREEARSKIV